MLPPPPYSYSPHLQSCPRTPTPRLLRQVARGVAYMHSRGAFHSDLKVRPRGCVGGKGEGGTRLPARLLPHSPPLLPPLPPLAQPANVLLRRGVAKVADLGLAKLAAGVHSLSSLLHSAGGGGAEGTQTAAPGMRGTPIYRCDEKGAG